MKPLGEGDKDARTMAKEKWPSTREIKADSYAPTCSTSRPHLKLTREGCSSDGWCVHYAGFYKPGIGEGRITHCDAGVEYDSVKKEVEYTYSHGDGYKFTAKQAHPCFKDQAGLTDGCAKCHYPSPEEIAANRAEMDKLINGFGIARAGIIAELEKRLKNGGAEVNMNAHSDAEVADGPTNFVSGAGIMDCPVCKTGKLRYSRAAYNGHVHAECSTKDCVAWME